MIAINKTSEPIPTPTLDIRIDITGSITGSIPISIPQLQQTGGSMPISIELPTPTQPEAAEMNTLRIADLPPEPHPPDQGRTIRESFPDKRQAPAGFPQLVKTSEPTTFPTALVAYEFWVLPNDLTTVAKGTITSDKTSLKHFSRACWLLWEKQDVQSHVQEDRTARPVLLNESTPGFSGPGGGVSEEGFSTTCGPPVQTNHHENKHSQGSFSAGLRSVGQLPGQFSEPPPLLNRPEPWITEITQDLLVAVRNELLAEGYSPDSARKVQTTIRKICRAAADRIPSIVIPKNAKIKRETLRPIMAEPEEIAAFFTACDAATWPNFLGISPAHVWRTWAVLFTYFGASTQDFAAYKSASRLGLLWSSLSSSSRCPDRSIPAEHPAGWIEYTREKTKGTRGGSIILPRNDLINAMLEPFRGLDPLRVFPNGRSKTLYTKSCDAIKAAAGLSPGFSFSGSGTRSGIRPRSARKLCGFLWDQAAAGLGAFVLGNVGADTYQKSYQQATRQLGDNIDRVEVPSEFHDYRKTL